MSADDWQRCPKCGATPAADLAKKIKELETSGDVLLKDLNKMKEDYKKMPCDEITCRLDYELWMSPDGKFCVDASAQCTKCKTKWTIKTELPSVG